MDPRDLLYMSSMNIQWNQYLGLWMQQS